MFSSCKMQVCTRMCKWVCVTVGVLYILIRQYCYKFYLNLVSLKNTTNQPTLELSFIYQHTHTHNLTITINFFTFLFLPLFIFCCLFLCVAFLHFYTWNIYGFRVCYKILLSMEIVSFLLSRSLSLSRFPFSHWNSFFFFYLKQLQR